MLVLQRFQLLLWKNLVLMRRQYIVTALEIILPTLFAVLMAYLRTIDSVDAEQTWRPPDANFDHTVNTTYYEEFSENNLISSSKGLIRCTGFVNITLPFSPNTTFTQKIIQDLSSMLNPDKNESCKVNWQGFETEEEIELLNMQIGTDISNISVMPFALIFTEGNNVTSEYSGKVAYKIRITDYYGRVMNTKEIMPWFPIPGPSRNNEQRYSTMGFSGLQILMDKILIRYFTKQEPQFNITTQGFPYPPYPAIDFNMLYGTLLPQMLILGFIFIVPSIIRQVVSEKETGIKELMKLMGLPNWMHWLGWMINSLLVLIISISIVTLIFYIEFESGSGAVFQDTDWTLWWFVQLLYVIAASAFCFFVSAFFKRPTLATTVGIVLWLVTYFGVFYPFERQYDTMNLPSKMSICLLPNMGLHFAIKTIAGYEMQSVGAKWNNIWVAQSAVDTLTLGHVCVMFVVSTFIYIALTLYIEKVVPSDFGVRKPWYYIFNPREYLNTKSTSKTMTSTLTEESSLPDSFEPDPVGLEAGIEIKGLGKLFADKKIAVDSVTLNMYHGQITALLGHNGAGKTTTISMLTGMISATKGTAFVNGHNINTDMEGVRTNLGLCPQHNMLFDKLTVEEHARFFGRLKGLSSDEVKEESKKLIDKLQLTDKKDKLSGTLSGGQKRRLSLACALVGGTKVVILDEPTSGLDPESRRAIWDVLLEMRSQRTILLTTHFMEEADVLGDRIAIMADGKVQCCGTPMFLKRFYGAGYTLRIVANSVSNPDSIISSVKKHIPSSHLIQTGNLDNEKRLILIAIPTGDNSSAQFPLLFTDLSLKQSELSIENVGLSVTTMDDVFLRVRKKSTSYEEIARESSPGLSSDSRQTSTNNLTFSSRENLTGSNQSKVTGLSLMWSQFMALLLKKMLYTFRKRKLFISQFGLPVLLLIAAILISNTNFGTPNRGPPLTMTLSSYRDPVTLFNFPDNLVSCYKNAVGSSAKRAGNISESLLQVANDDLGVYRQHYIVAHEFVPQNLPDFPYPAIRSMFSSIPRHSAPLSINLASNTILKSMIPDDRNLFIEVINHPIKSGISEMFEAASVNPQFVETVAIIFSVFMPIGLGLLAASYIVCPVEEKNCKSKQLQLMTGVHPILYWGTSFLWDYFAIILVICVMTACFPIFETHKAFTNNNGAGVAFLILFVYGFSAISFSYMFSLYVKSVPGGFSLVAIVHILTGMGLNLVVFALRENKRKNIGDVIGWIGRLFPTYGAAAATMRYTELSTANARCQILPANLLMLLCSLTSDSVRNMQTCCPNCKALGVECFKPTPYLTWSSTRNDTVFDSDLRRDVWKIQTYPEIGQELTYMFVMGIVYKVILIGIEMGVFTKFFSSILKTRKHVFKNSDKNDEDVQEENKRVDQIVASKSQNEHALIVHSLCKNYGSHSAVSNLSFAVDNGECFGLLGVNGAGKTTTFQMLTADEIISNGQAFLNGHSLKEKRREFLKSIGYCPQFDGIVGVLTGNEMLRIFAKLRGISSDRVQHETEKWLHNMDLFESANVQCAKYSGGMKRRLCTAMAMIGDPPFIMLDEPTTGVDPVARRRLWEIINSVKANGQSIILTSHSMEECEALCTRLGIMVNGQLQCLGNSDHLKSKFGQGYTLLIKLRPMFEPISTNDNVIMKLQRRICSDFGLCELREHHQYMVKFHIGDNTISWKNLFEKMELIKSSYPNLIEEYSLNETTLEEIFLSFARKQYGDRVVDISFVRKCLTCQWF